MNKFIDKDSKCPDVTFRTVDIVNESFWTHIHRTPNGDISEIIFSLNSESKVC
jgi:hypothetical protein